MSRFRLRDPSDLEEMLSFNNDSVIRGVGSGNTHSDYSASLSSDGDVDSELQSMTAKGISHFCSELMELRNEADEDFQKSIFANYSSFLKAFEEMEGLESELLELKYHTQTQKTLIKVLMDRLSVNDLTEQMVESMLDEDSDHEQLSPSILEAHRDDVSEIMDTLLSEHRLDEAISVLEMEARTFQSMDFGENFTSDDLMSYESAISEKRALLVHQLVLVAENLRVSAPELQKALVGICKLGEEHLANRLLFNYYHARITRGMHDLHLSKLSSPELYCRELAKFVFSMISQVERSFVALHGEASSYGPDIAQWASEETEHFAKRLDKYIRSVTEITDGLSTAVEAVQFALSYCSLLEYQKNVARACLINNLRPALDQVLQLHIDHYKKVINICTLTDTWVLGRFLVSGILSKEASFTKDHTKPEYCLLTNSGRKFVTLFQAVTNDSLPLVALQMENSICRGLVDLFEEYTMMLEKAMTSFATKEDGSETDFSLSLVQGVSVIANSSTLVQFFFDIVESVSGDTNLMKFEIEDLVPFIQEAHNRLRSHFFEQVILHNLSPESDLINDSENYVNLQDDQDVSSLMPSARYQELFLQLRKVQKFAEGNCIPQEWLVYLLRQLMETIFIAILSKDDLIQMPPNNMKQFILDIRFLEEIAKSGGYWSENIKNATREVVSDTHSDLGSTEFALESEEDRHRWATDAAKVALQRLEEVAEEESATNDEIPDYLEDDDEEETNEYESANSSDLFEDEDDNASVSADQTIINSPLKNSRIMLTPASPCSTASHNFEENDLLEDEDDGISSEDVTKNVMETSLSICLLSEEIEEEVSSPLNFEMEMDGITLDGLIISHPHQVSLP